MPTATAVAFDSLLLARQSVVDGARSGSRGDLDCNDRVAKRATSSSPALYATPQAFRISADPTMSSDALSPYVVDRKGRGPVAAAENGGQPIKDAEGGRVIEKQRDEGEEEVKDESPVPPNKGVDSDARGGDVAGLGAEDLAPGTDDDDFFDSRASLRSASFSDAESSSGAGGGRLVTFIRRDTGSASFGSNNEYCDAGSHFGLDSPAGRSSRMLDEMESELRSLRLGLFDELEKKAEALEALARLRGRWNRMASGLSKVGVSLFAPIPVDGEEPRWEQGEGEKDAAELVGSEIVVTRAVSEAIAWEVGRAEGEESAQAAVEAKNREIARLRDRLNYYEAVNHEMSQRNLEIAERARRRRQRRKTVRRYMWASIGFVVATGIPLLAYTYLHLPRSNNTSSPPSADAMEASSST